MKTPIRVGVGGTKKTKNRSGQKGSHDNANPRKIHEKNEKSEWSKGKPRQRRCTKNPRKKRKNRNRQKGSHCQEELLKNATTPDKIMVFTRMDPELFENAGCAEPRCDDFQEWLSRFQGDTCFSLRKGTPGPQISESEEHVSFSGT